MDLVSSDHAQRTDSYSLTLHSVHTVQPEIKEQLLQLFFFPRSKTHAVFGNISEVGEVGELLLGPCFRNVL